MNVPCYSTPMMSEIEFLANLNNHMWNINGDTDVKEDASIILTWRLDRLAAESGPYTRHFSFGCDHVDPDTGASLYQRYITVTALTPDDCQRWMFASKFGRNWSHEYIPDTTQANTWIPRWTEHAHITLTEFMPFDQNLLSRPAEWLK